MTEKKKGKKSVGKLITAIISGAVFLFAIIIFLSVMTSRIKGDVPRVFGYSFHIVMTDSMTPEINVGDLVIAKKTEESEIKVGDDIVFVSPNPKHNGIYLVHRVVRILSDGRFITQGVKPGAPEDAYPVKEIEGKRVAVSPSLGNFFKGIGTNKNWLFFTVIAVIVVVIVVEIINIVMNVTNKKKGVPTEKEVFKKEQEERAERIAALERQIKELAGGATKTKETDKTTAEPVEDEAKVENGEGEKEKSEGLNKVAEENTEENIEKINDGEKDED